MARVTVEDCIEKLPNRYELVVLAARRAKDIASGVPITLPRDNDKDAVVALREIAEGTVPVDNLREGVVQNFQQKQSIEQFLAKAEAAEKDAKSVREEVDAAFAAEQIEANQPDQKALDKAGMSFAGDDVAVED